MTYAPINSITAFLPTTQVFPEEDSQFLIKLTSVYTQIAQSTNIKDIALYDLIEQLNGQQFFYPNDPQKKRQAFRKVFSFDAIAAGATLNIPHGLTNVTLYTRIYGTCITDTVDYRPIPFCSTVNITNQISIRIVGNNLSIVNGATAPNITSGIAVLEYLKN